MSRTSNGVSNEQGPILVAVDFSDYSRTALIWAGELAQALGAPIVLLHVVHDPAEAPGYYRKDMKNTVRPMKDVAESMMQDFLQEVRNANSELESLNTLETILVTGLPVTQILTAADKLKARMIVMGSQGLTGLTHLLIGSKAEQVVRLAKIPVTIVKVPNEE